MNAYGAEILNDAMWIWPQWRTFDLYNTYAHFRKDFVLDEAPLNALLYITADQSYRLRINGNYVTRGPARGFQDHWPYDEVEVSGWLKKGANYLSIEVYNPGVSTFGYVTQGSAGLLCAGIFGDVRIISDSSWISRIDSSHKRDTAHYSIQLSFQEHVDMRKDDRTWITSPEIPASKEWVKPIESVYGVMPWHSMEERGIPQLRETLRTPKIIISRGDGKVSAGCRNWRNIASGLYKEFNKTEWKPDGDEVSQNSSILIPASGKGRFRAAVLDMGETLVGPSILSIDEGGKSGLVIDIFYHERLDESYGRGHYQPPGQFIEQSSGLSFGPSSGQSLVPVIMDPDVANCNQSMANRLILSGNKVRYDFYQLLGFRYATVVIRENDSPVSLRLQVSDTGYPYTLSGKFKCSDQTLNDIWKICKRTEQVCSLDAYVDTPWREQAQWWGDARIQFWNTMAIDGDTRLLKRGIRSIATQKVPNGLTYGHAPTIAHFCILPDFSLVWIVTIYDYYRQTKNLSLFEEQLPRIREVLSYFKNEAPKYKGLICYDSRYWLFLDWSDIEKEGASALYNMWYLLALKITAELLKKTGRGEESNMLCREAEELEKAVTDMFFDDKTGLFRDAVYPNGRHSTKHSVHSQTFAIMLGLKKEFHDNMLRNRILPFLRGEKLDVSVPSTYWISYVISVAREQGYFKEALDFIKKMWASMIPLSTCLETFDGGIGEYSASHAWSAHPVFHLMNILGGVAQDGAGWDTISFEPYFAPELDYVRIKYPSPYGLIESSWERCGGNTNISLKLPEGVTAKVKIPGFEGEVRDNFLSCIPY